MTDPGNLIWILGGPLAILGGWLLAGRGLGG